MLRNAILSLFLISIPLLSPLVDSSFESGGLDVTLSGSATVVTTVAHTGTHSVQIPASSSVGYLSFPFATDNATVTYYVSGTGSIRILSLNCTDYAPATNIVHTVSGSWTRIEDNLVAPDCGTAGEVYFSAIGGTVYLDDVYLSADEPTVTPIPSNTPTSTSIPVVTVTPSPTVVPIADTTKLEEYQRFSIGWQLFVGASVIGLLILVIIRIRQ